MRVRNSISNDSEQRVTERARSAQLTAPQDFPRQTERTTAGLAGALTRRCAVLVRLLSAGGVESRRGGSAEAEAAWHQTGGERGIGSPAQDTRGRQNGPARADRE